MFKPTKKQHLVNKNYADKNGGSGGAKPLIVKASGGTLDHTWQEIVDAPMAWLEKTSGTRIARHPLSGVIVDEGTKYSVVFDGTSYVTFMPDEQPAKDDVSQSNLNHIGRNQWHITNNRTWKYYISNHRKKGSKELRRKESKHGTQNTHVKKEPGREARSL